MKTQLRKITINDKIYLYTKADYLGNEQSRVKLRIFLQGEKTTPLIIDFLTKDDFILGNPLKNGVKLFNQLENQTQIVNINHPKLIRALILLGIENGWTGKNIIGKQDGLAYLQELGFAIDDILPKNTH